MVNHAPGTTAAPATERASQSDHDEKNQPPFPLERPTSASWREQALSKIAELRFVRDWLLDCRSQTAGEVRTPGNGAARFVRHWLLDGRPQAAGEVKGEGTPPGNGAAQKIIDDHLETAAKAAKGGPVWKPRNLLAGLTGSSVERVMTQLDAVEGELLRIASSEYLVGEIPNLLAHVQLHLRPDDPRRLRIEAIAQHLAGSDQNQNDLERSVSAERVAKPQQRSANGVAAKNRRQAPPSSLAESDRQAVISAVRAASAESRLKVSRLRSFRNVILVSALLLTLAAVGITVFAFERPSALPMCFTPANVVCTTSTTRVPLSQLGQAGGQQTAISQARTESIERRVATGWDVLVVELVGLIAAAIAATAALRNVRGTSTPYSLPVALAALKLPTGALTALLGLLLMRGGFVPGLSALDSSAQIIAWALVFGYAQQLFTRLVDSQAQTVLEGATGNEKSLAPPPALVQSAAAPVLPTTDK